MGLQAGAVTQAAENPAPEMHDAKVIWYSQIDGYGFLMVDGYPFDLFLHFRQVKESGIPPGELKKGMRVRCAIGTEQNPKPGKIPRQIAVNLERA